MVSGVVLAGGTGSRMGLEKGLVRVCSRPMVLMVVDAVSSVADDIIVSVGIGRAPDYTDLCGPRVRVVEDAVAGRGPLEGLVRAFGAAKDRLAVVVPCDTPLVRTEVLELLISRTTDADGAVPVVDGYREPLVAAYVKDRALASFQEELSAGRGKVCDAIVRMKLNLVPEEDLRKVDPDLATFLNVNSREDLEEAEELMLRLRPAP